MQKLPEKGDFLFNMDRNRSSSYSRQNRDQQFEERVVQINRVSKKTKGGNKIRFSALVVVGDRGGHVGVGLGKSSDVSSAIAKAVSYAKKRFIKVPIRKDTIPYDIRIKIGAAEILFKPAPIGSGIIAGGAVRSVIEVAGIRNISAKILGTENKASNVHATFEALRRLSD